MTNKIDYSETDTFKRDLKKLEKRYPTLSDDLAVAKRNALELFHLHNIDSHAVELLQSYSNEIYQIYKLRKFACRALKGRGVKSGIRIIYAYDEASQKIAFIEIYFKADQEKENRCKIEDFFKSKRIF